jgi:putative ABC transport system permease protein
MHDVLVSAQVALSIALLVVAGLVLRTFVSVSSLDPGFSYDRLLVTHVSTSSTTMEPSDRERFFRQMAEGITEESWVRAATVADFPLLSPHMSAQLLLDGQTDPQNLVYSKVIPGFFEALQINVLQGRSFAETDISGAPDVAMVNESLARRYFPDQIPVGRRIRWPSEGGEERVFEIVGVVSDTKTRYFIEEPEPTVYFSYPQFPYPTGSALMVVTNYDPAAATQQLYRWLRDFEPHLAIVNVVTYPAVVSGYLYTQRMNAEMFSVLAFLGLGLAAVGIFSVMSLAVSRRTREIGIRMSIGAQRADIRRLVIVRAMMPVAIGLVVGLAVSFAVTRLVQSLLYGVEPTDPLTFAAGSAILVAAALLAAYLPARRATKVDPLLALRYE